MSTIMHQPFNYSELSPDVRTNVETATRRLHELERRIVGDVLEIGKHLIQVKAALPHGQFGPWLDAEFGWTDRTARNFMQAAEVFGDKSETVSDLGVTTLYALAADSTPEALRDELIERAAAGQRVTLKDVRQARVPERVAGVVDLLSDNAYAQNWIAWHEARWPEPLYRLTYVPDMEVEALAYYLQVVAMYCARYTDDTWAPFETYSHNGEGVSGAIHSMSIRTIYNAKRSGAATLNAALLADREIKRYLRTIGHDRLSELVSRANTSPEWG